MEAKPKLMKSHFENGLAVVCAVFAWIINGPHFDFTALLNITWLDLMIAALKLIQVGLAGMIGAVGGLAGKKYFFPWVEKKYKKFITKK